jgi:acyl-CoA thioesterase
MKTANVRACINNRFTRQNVSHLSIKSYASYTGAKPLGSKDPNAAFNRDTAVTKLGDGIYGGHVQPDWSVVVHPNGGYLLSMAISAMRGELNFRDPLTITTHFLSPTMHDQPCEIRVEKIKQSKRFETVTATMTQQQKDRDGNLVPRERARFIGTFGVLPVAGAAGDSSGHVRTTMPTIPPPGECIPDGFGPASVTF